MSHLSALRKLRERYFFGSGSVWISTPNPYGIFIRFLADESVACLPVGGIKGSLPPLALLRTVSPITSRPPTFCCASCSRMPPVIKRSRMSRDPAPLAIMIVDLATANAPPEPPECPKDPAAASLGRTAADRQAFSGSTACGGIIRTSGLGEPATEIPRAISGIPKSIRADPSLQPADDSRSSGS